MSFDRTPSEILAAGIKQAIKHAAPPKMITRLRGALALCNAGAASPLDRALAPKSASSVWIESIPPPDSAAVQDA